MTTTNARRFDTVAARTLSAGDVLAYGDVDTTVTLTRVTHYAAETHVVIADNGEEIILRGVDRVQRRRRLRSFFQ